MRSAIVWWRAAHAFQHRAYQNQGKIDIAFKFVQLYCHTFPTCA